jgi:hypothetical protein
MKIHQQLALAVHRWLDKFHALIFSKTYLSILRCTILLNGTASAEHGKNKINQSSPATGHGGAWGGEEV